MEDWDFFKVAMKGIFLRRKPKSIDENQIKLTRHSKD
jgi:hypothetical protein